MRGHGVDHKTFKGIVAMRLSLIKMIWLPSGQRELEEEVLKDVSVDEAWKHFAWHQEECAPRLAGTAAEKKQVEHYRKNLEEWGVPLVVNEYDAWVVDGPTWGPDKSPDVFAEVTVTYPEEKSLECVDRSGSTPPEGLEAGLVDIGKLPEGKISEENVKGKITIIFPTEQASTRPLAQADIRQLMNYGAVGHIEVSWRPFIRQGARAAGRFSVGNPTPEELETLIDLPVVAITKAEGEYLKELMEKGLVRVNLRNRTLIKWKKALQPYVKITGSADPEKHVVVGGHQDAIGAGATCNSAGLAVLLEFLRVLWKHRDKLRRSVKWLLWSGHESGTSSTGSIWYLDEFWDDIMRNCVATYTVDTPFIAKAGLSKGAVGYRSKNCPELRSFHEQVIRDIVPREHWDIEATTDTWLPGEKYVGLSCNHRIRAGDNTWWPWDIGVPSIFDGKRNSRISPYAHTVHDTIEVGGTPELMEDPIKVLLVSVLRACNCPVLPFEFIGVAEQYIEALTDYQNKGKGVYDMTPLIDMAEKLKRSAKELDDTIHSLMEKYEKADVDKKSSFEKVFNDINKALMKMSRILNPPFFSTLKRGKYSYDLHGAVVHPIPSLLPVVELTEMDPNSSEFKALRTKMVRARNRVADTLNDAIDLTEETTSKIETFSQ